MADLALFTLLILTIATVLQVGPDDVFLREAEHAQSPSSHAGVNDPLGVRHQLWTLKESSPGSHKVKLSQLTLYDCECI